MKNMIDSQVSNVARFIVWRCGGKSRGGENRLVEIDLKKDWYEGVYIMGEK